MFTFVMLVVVVIVAAVVKSISNGSNQSVEGKERVNKSFHDNDQNWNESEHFTSVKSVHNIHDINNDDY